MEMKKFALTLLAALGIVASAMAYADASTSSTSSTVEKVDIQPVGSGDIQVRKCPPFCI